ncbi:MAG TPA: SDR family NAD(P)-dependent oxidoreductase [Streptomyces sp.]
MELSGARALVAGATGVLGGAITAEVAGRGAREALAGRDPSRLARAAQAYPGAPTVRFDACDPAPCARADRDTSAAFPGLDAVVAFGAVALGAAQEVGDEVAEHLPAVSHLAPAAFVRAALDVLRPGSTVAAVTGVVAGRPQPRMADHSASQAALRAWLETVRRETRSAGVGVLEVRPEHLDTGFAQRPVAGTAPPLPRGGDPRQLAAAVEDAPAADAEPVRTGPDRTPVVEGRAR